MNDEIASILEKLWAAWTDRDYPDAVSCGHVSMIYRSLCAAAGADGLHELQTLSDDTIALQAAWESLALAGPAELITPPIRLDREKVNWFSGFLEGRARVSLPEGWRQILVLDARTNQRGNIFVPLGEPKRPPYRFVGSFRVQCPINASIETAGKDVVFRVGDDTIVVPEDLLHRNMNGELYCRLSGCFTSEHFFLAVHDAFGSPHDLTCIDRSSGRLLWKSRACGSYQGAMMGKAECWVWVTATSDGRVFSFGAGTDFYVHGFDASDGKSLLHFCSSY